MNAPLRQRELDAAAGTLQLFALFHLNLAFSSIEEERRPEVIRRCYWPLLDLAAAHGPIGVELTGLTLEEIARHDPEWIGRVRVLIAAGQIELIGSGYAQIIGPLVPACVTERNLALGNELYAKWLNCRPKLALINEQAYSAGLVGLYLDAGYRGILMDWDNCAAHHPEWAKETRYRPQRALGNDGRAIDLLWTNTVAFQKLQRLAHGDISQAEYVRYVRGQTGLTDRLFCLYASDAEVFDFRPGRFRTEEALAGSEWQRIADAFAALAETPDCTLVRPGDALTGAQKVPLRLESAACPVPVKKQRKYNLSRWAVTGRDDIAINATCQRICSDLVASNATDADWKELCYLWSSDFRTHITEKRWSEFCKRLQAAEMKWAADAPVPSRRAARGAKLSERHIRIETPSLIAVLDRRRGLAIESLRFAGNAAPTVGGLPHGHFDDIALQADWYTGDCVFEAPGEPKVTDLEWCEAHQFRDNDGNVCVHGRIETPNGPIEKTLTFFANESKVEFDIAFHWHDWGRGSLRLGHVTLLPAAFDLAALSLTTHNGGKLPETFCLNGASVDHGAPVSFLVSCSYGFGMTEGWAEIGDNATRLRVCVDREIAPLLGLLTHRRVGDSLFCQLVLSALELDETRTPTAYREGPRRFRFSIQNASAVALN
jgi:hypothetical protein